MQPCIIPRMKLAEYLAKNDMRPSHLAARIGSPNTTISRLVRGETKPSWGLMRRIAEATNGKVNSIDDYAVPEAGRVPSDGESCTDA